MQLHSVDCEQTLLYLRFRLNYKERKVGKNDSLLFVLYCQLIKVINAMRIECTMVCAKHSYPARPSNSIS
jgi:hypothetical protein